MATRSVNTAKILLDDFLGIIFPEVCPGCSLSLSWGENHLCTQCISSLPTLRRVGFRNEMMSKYLDGREGYSFLNYHKKGIVQSIIRKIKYDNQPELGKYLGKWFATEALEYFQPAEYIIPVPLHERKMKMRGYNQSAKISEGISDVTDIPVLSDILFRDSFTDTQTRKSRLSRMLNMENVFSARSSSKSADSMILLVDDVFTTGATLYACITALEEVGFNNIIPLTLATAK